MTPQPHDSHQLPVDLSDQQRRIADEANRKMRDNWEEMQKAEKNKAEQKKHSGGVTGQAIIGGTDLWKHRSTGMQCQTCMWYAEKVGTVHGLGRCRRHAPTMGGYPVVFNSDWCGDHRLDENKGVPQ